MKYSKILLVMAVLVCLAFQASAQSGYFNPHIGNADEGLASMLQWIDRPVPNYPWYSSSGGSFYTQPYSDTTFSPFREYYTPTGTPVVGGIISNPTKFDITQRTPSRIYYGTGQGLPYIQYISTVPSKTNDLWIQGATNWTQYVVSPVGTWLQLVANAPVGGPAGFYEMIQTDTTSSKYNTYQFNPGYNTMNFYADQVGRHTLYFVVNNQPSNVVVVDVFAQAQPGTGTGGIVSIAGQNQPIVPGGNGQNYYTPNGLTTTTSNGQTTTTTSNGQTIITPIGQPTTSFDGTYQTTTSSDGTTQTTTTSDGTGTIVTSSHS
jgi:hypothetical protein